jgi:hypothetical protein
LNRVHTHRAGVEYRYHWDEKLRSIKPEMTSKFNFHPVSVTLNGAADIQGRMYLKITMKLWTTVPLVIQPEPYIGLLLKMGSDSGCEMMTALGYQTYWGLDLTLGLEKIQVKLWKLRLTVSFNVLPWKKTFGIVKRQPVKKLSGCLKVRAPPPAPSLAQPYLPRMQPATLKGDDVLSAAVAP